MRTGVNMMETEWLQLLDQTPVVMITLDLEGFFTALNPAAARAFGRAHSELHGTHFSTVLDLYSHAKAVRMISSTLQQGSVSEWELDHLRPSGEVVLLGYTTCVLRDVQGNPIGIGAMGVDLTSKVQLTGELAKANQELEGALCRLERTYQELKATQSRLVQSEKMRTLGQLVAGISHEINNPAAFISNNLDQLQILFPRMRTLFDEYSSLKQLMDSSQLQKMNKVEKAIQVETLWLDLGEILEESRDGIQRIRDIVSALRTFSHLGGSEVKKVDVSTGLLSTLQIIRSSCGQRIELIEDLHPLPPIECHPGEINQVFLNLLTNAVQSIRVKGRIQVSTRTHPEMIEIIIQDDGVGMDENTLSHLGEPFFTTKSVGEGTGLGLSISYGIIKNHGGKLLFDSRPGMGTRARLELPTSIHLS